MENSAKLPTRPRETEEEARTIRNVLPWRNMEKELAKRLAEKAAKGELSASGEIEKNPLLFGEAHAPPAPASRPSSRPIRTPESGVRAAVMTPEELAGPLSYRVYTVAQLDTREVRVLAPSAASQSVPWSRVWASALGVVRAWRACARSPQPRPRVRDVCKVPLAAFFADLRSALGALPVRKIAFGGGIALGSILFFLFAVITVAELTDDMKPARTTTPSLAETAPAAPVLAPPPAPTAEPEPPPIELDDDVTPAPTKAKAAKPFVKSKAKKAAPSRGAEPTSI